MCAKSQADKSNYEDYFDSVRVHLPRTNCKIKEIKYVQILNPEPLDRVTMKEKSIYLYGCFFNIKVMAVFYLFYTGSFTASFQRNTERRAQLPGIIIPLIQ